jgi:hypothetical protein
MCPSPLGLQQQSHIPIPPIFTTSGDDVVMIRKFLSVLFAWAKNDPFLKSYLRVVIS